MKKSVVAVVAALSMVNAYALDQVSDPRSLALGGGSVASANGMNAIFLNPGALPALQDEAFTFEMPVTFRLINGKAVKDNVQVLNDKATALSNALSAFQNAPNQAAAGPAATAVTNFDVAMKQFGADPLLGNGNVGLMMAMPGRKTVSWALLVGARVEFGAQFNYATGDSATFTSLAGSLTSCAANAANCSTLTGVDSNGQITNLNSTFTVVGAGIAEVGLALAGQANVLDGLDIGVTPKMLSVTSFQKASGAQSGNASTSSSSGNNTQKDSVFTMDVGIAKSFPLGSGNTVRTGFVVKNMLSKTLQTPADLSFNQPSRTINIAPQMTVGAAYSTGWFNGMLDVDLLKQKELIEGITPQSQFVRLGAELDAGGWAQLRAGYRHDLAGNYSGLASVGVGLNLKLVNLDIAAAAAGDKEVALSIQLGSHF